MGLWRFYQSVVDDENLETECPKNNNEIETRGLWSSPRNARAIKKIAFPLVQHKLHDAYKDNSTLTVLEMPKRFR